MKALRVLLLVLGALLVVAVAAGLWLLRSTSGARWAIGQVAQRTPGTLRFQRIEGNLAGPLVLHEVAYSAPKGAGLRVDRVRADVSLLRLMRGELDMADVRLDGVDVLLPEETAPQPEVVAAPFALPTLDVPSPPLRVHLRNVGVHDAAVRRGATEIVRFDELKAAGRWTPVSVAVERLTVVGPDGEAELKAEVPVGTARPLTADGDVRWRWNGAEYVATLTSRAEAETSRVELSLQAPFAVRATAWVPPGGGEWRLQLEVPEFDPRGTLLPAEHGLRSAGGSLAATGSAARLGGEGSVELNGETVRLDQVDLRVEQGNLRIASLHVGLPEYDAHLRASGLIAREADSSIQVAWDEFQLPEAWTRRVLRTRGELQLAGRLPDMRVTGTLALGPPDRLSDLEVAAERRGDEIRLESLRIVQPDGAVTARGTVRTGPALSWELALDAASFNPGEFAAAWPGRLSGQLQTQGRFGGGAAEGEIAIERLEGTLRDRPVSGHGRIALDDDRLVTGTLRFASGGTQVNVDTLDSEVPAASVSLHVESLGNWLPGAAGSVSADFRVTGQWPSLGVVGRATATALRYAQYSAGDATIDARLEDVRALRGELAVNARKVRAAGREIPSVQLEARGDETGHRVRAEVDGGSMGGAAEVRGQWETDRWNGTVEKLNLRWTEVAALALQQPVALRFSRDGAFEISRLCLADGSLWLCLEGTRTGPGRMNAAFALEEVPLRLLAMIAPARWPELDGRIGLEGQATQEAGQWTGEARLFSAGAQVTVGRADAGETAPAPTLPLYENLTVEARLEAQTLTARVSAGLVAQGRLDAQGSVTLGADGKVEGKVDAVIPSIAPLATLLPQATGVDGRVVSALQFAGDLRAPDISGHLEVANLRGGLPRVGLELADGHFRVEPGPNRSMGITGSIAAGEGRVDLAGRWVPGGESRLTVKGEKFLATNLPSARVVIAPDLVVALQESGVRVTGRVAVPTAGVNLQQLPQGRARRVSRDVVVVDRRTEQKERRQFPFGAEVVVEVGPEVEVTGFGLAAKLRGRLTVVEAPGAPTTASGEIVLEGTYEGYGQDLKITRGRVLYAATPIADPRLDITAVRELEDVKAGVRISGTAQAPELSVFADPAMGQAEALSYLVTGKPIDSVGAGAETDMLDSAARSLGTAAGAMVAERIGRRLGIDEVGIEKSDMIDGEVFTIGQYLSPRLYVAYGVGLFDAGDLVTLRYKLSESLDLRAVRGPEDTRAGIEYRIER